MDKEIMKKLAQISGIPIGKFISIKKKDLSQVNFEEIFQKFEKPLFIKPSNSGSSIGVSKVMKLNELKKAIEKAFDFDNKILIEQGIKGRELEIGMLEIKGEIKTSSIGEIKYKKEFYDYDAKYSLDSATELIIPAKVNKITQKEIKKLAIKIFEVFECKDFARIDFFITEKNEVIFNEINTIPGFTQTSMYPKLWEASGINYPELIEILINNQL